METNTKNRLAKAFKTLEPNSFKDGDDIRFCFLMEENLKKKLLRNSVELEFFIKKIGYIYYQRVLNDIENEKIELKLDQLYWSQFLPIKRKCISETITDTINILVYHPDIKRYLKFTDRNDEENSIRKFLQEFNDYMIDYLNDLLVRQFKKLRKIAINKAYKRRLERRAHSRFQCEGCGNMCTENNPIRASLANNVAFNMMMGGFVYQSSDESSDSEEDNEDQEDSSDSDVEDEDQEDSSAGEIEMKKKSKKKTYRKKVLHFTHGKY